MRTLDQIYATSAEPLVDLSLDRRHKLILCCPLCPGDVMTLTAAVESLHLSYPEKFLTDVRTDFPEVWHFNPWITPIEDDDPDAITIDVNYSRQIVESNRIPHHFLACYTNHVGKCLGIPLTLQVNRPCLYLVDHEKQWPMVQRFFGQYACVPVPSKPIWLVCAGSKSDYPAKQWPVEYFQQVINATRDAVLWVQVGSNEQGNFPHAHPRLKNCINLVGKTSHRELYRLMHHACGGLGGVTYLMHVAAAIEKPYICLAGGREPATWIRYPKLHWLHTIGQLPCCENWSCWKARVVPVNDGRDLPEKMCERPVLDMAMPVAECMRMIGPDEVVAIVRRQLVGTAA